ncbi:class I SAM-dependent methyltransferase [Sphingomonas kyeonggiensis]|uniref:SAM-dependent methyltransferase n=1 Tax=Sphingomonas kyeonggiensis TaxID=1268553 RepID=A0A7W6JYF9_9SPHN|nr:SAM-dependent methyltransferase [Sphingomonas kyeonggiensis]
MEKIVWSITGNAWVEAEALLDGMYAPFEAMLAQEIPAGAKVLDVGCGTGATTVAAAHRAGADGEAFGVDISEPMITAARARATREGVAARFELGDAQDFAFEAGRFDRLISRFGLMFFDDFVAAFANLRRAAAPGAMLHAIAWRNGDENPFMMEAERVAAPLLPGFAVRPPIEENGQFAFGDPARVLDILASSGWQDAALAPIAVSCTFPAAALPFYLARLGPVGRALEGSDPELRDRVLAAVLPAFDRHVVGDEVRFDAACWSISARA